MALERTWGVRWTCDDRSGWFGPDFVYTEAEARAKAEERSQVACWFDFGYRYEAMPLARGDGSPMEGA